MKKIILLIILLTASFMFCTTLFAVPNSCAGTTPTNNPVNIVTNVTTNAASVTPNLTEKGFTPSDSIIVLPTDPDIVAKLINYKRGFSLKNIDNTVHEVTTITSNGVKIDGPKTTKEINVSKDPTYTYSWKLNDQDDDRQTATFQQLIWYTNYSSGATIKFDVKINHSYKFNVPANPPKYTTTDSKEYQIQ